MAEDGNISGKDPDILGMPGPEPNENQIPDMEAAPVVPSDEAHLGTPDASDDKSPDVDSAVPDVEHPDSLDAPKESRFSPAEIEEMLATAVPEPALGIPKAGVTTKPPFRDFMSDDPLGMAQHAAETTDEHMATRQVQEEQLGLQSDINRIQHHFNERLMDHLHRLDLDNHNDLRRLEYLTSALERSRNTLTDTNI